MITYKPPLFDIDALAKEAGLKYHEYDSLPLGWYDDVHAKTGYWPQEYGFVWSYADKSVWGEPFPLTMEAKILLDWYNQVTGNGNN